MTSPPKASSSTPKGGAERGSKDDEVRAAVEAEKQELRRRRRSSIQDVPVATRGRRMSVDGPVINRKTSLGASELGLDQADDAAAVERRVRLVVERRIHGQLPPAVLSPAICTVSIEESR